MHATTKYILLLGLFAAYVGVANCYKIYALSKAFEVWENGNWKNVSTDPARASFIGQRLMMDEKDNIYLQLTYLWPDGIVIWNTTSNGWSPITYRRTGPLAFNANNDICATDRYDRAYWYHNSLFCGEEGRYASFEGTTTDLTAFREGRKIVVVGNFTQITTNFTLSPDGQQLIGTLVNVSRNVAFWDTKTRTFHTMGAGIASLPQRIVSNSDGTQLVAFSDQSTLWRWNGTSEVWVRHNLALTSIHGHPSINDLSFGGSKLFVVGNFDKVNGVTCKNVTVLSFGPKGSLSVAGIGLGLPGVQPKTVFARSATQIFIGGSAKGNRKVVYEWRQGRNVPWGRIGAIGSEDSGPVYGVVVAN